MLLYINIMISQINTIKDLNTFVVKQGLATPHEIINKLANSNVVISHSVARLIAKAFASPH